MNPLSCTHCGKEVKAEEQSCSHCGQPLPPNHAQARQRSFIGWFVVIVLFCIGMMLWLPPDWSPFMGK
jgi:predicted nucleic acid-binding Zn ribbon protein